MAKDWIKVRSFVCERCGHEWIPRVPLEELKSGKIKEEPVICPKCKSPYWNKPKKNKTNKEVQEK